MRVTVIGIDGLDPDLVRAWSDELPTLASLLASNPGSTLSVFPPDSVPAWASIFTGKAPSEHGVMGYLDYLSKAPEAGVGGGFAHVLRGQTFWDQVVALGKKVCVVNPFIAYPPWAVRGVMVSGPVGTGEPLSVPEGKLPKSGGPVLGGIPDFPKQSDLSGFIERTRSDIDALDEYARALFSQDVYDLAFVTFLQLDRVQHFFWRHMDEGDSTHPRSSEHAGVIKDFYRQFERVVAGFVRRAGEDEAVVVLSDHGQRRRCEKVFNVNELLREAGLLAADVRGVRLLDRRYLLERAKTIVLRTVYRLSLEEQAYALATRLPNRKALKTSEHVISRGASVATTSNIGGTNPYGGVVVDRVAAAERGLTYDEVVARVCGLLADAVVSEGVHPVLWAKPRSELYQGSHAEEFPDVLFELLPEYGVGFSLYDGLWGPNTMHRRISGGHQRKAFFGARAPRHDAALPAALEDIAGYLIGLVSSEGSPAAQS